MLFTLPRMARSTSRPILSKVSAPLACWRLSRIGTGVRIEPCTPYGSRARCSCCICSKEVQARSGHTQGRYRPDPRASAGRGAVRQGDIAMKKQRVVRSIPVEEGSGNIYTDLGYWDSESMLVKAQLAAKIAEILQRRALTQARAAEILGLTQPKVSALLKGRFRGISEHRLLECLTRLGRDVHIVIKPTPRSRPNGRLTLSV